MMKNLKTLLAAAALLMTTATVSAQSASYGIKGGVNFSNFYGEDLDGKNAKVGFNVGLFGDFEVAPSISIQSGLFFTTKGAEYKYNYGEIASGTVTLNPMYLQIPVHAAYKVDVTPGTRVVLHAGPYAAYGVGGKIKLSGKIAGVATDLENNVFEKAKSGDIEVVGMKRFDAGLGLGVGAEFGRLLVDLGWDMGLVNVSQSSSDKVKNQSGYLSVGYIF